MSDAAEVLKDADERGLRRALIVTALPLERDAVRAHLTELGVCVGDDDELYECYEYRCGGKIGDITAQGWLVIVAECGAGTHVAQSAVMYANQMFKPFEVILFIGIVFWAYSSRRKRAFDEAARLPLEDEMDSRASTLIPTPSPSEGEGGEPSALHATSFTRGEQRHG